jgi:hypothetical protein
MTCARQGARVRVFRGSDPPGRLLTHLHPVFVKYFYIYIYFAATYRPLLSFELAG